MKLLVPSLLCGLAAALPTNSNKTAEYEFVIIGSGPGGGTLA